MSSLPRLSTRNDEAIARQLQESSDAEYAQQLVSGERSSSQTRSDAEFARRLAQQPGPPAAPSMRAPAPGRANCPRGCGLRPFQASAHQVIQCNGCGQRVAAGRRTLSCLRCDYDLCDRCVAQPPRAPARSPRPVDGYARSAGVDAGMVLVACRLGTANVEMMVDTGAQHSVISAPLAQALGLMDRLDTSQQGIAAGVGRARILGKLRGVAAYFHNVEFALDLSVLEVQDQLLLLGLDQLRRFKVIVDLEKDCLVFGGSGGVRVPFLAQEASRRARVRLEGLGDIGCRQM